MGATGINAIATTEAALAQSKAIAATADNTAANLANKTTRNIGTLETSFIKGGISLDNLGGTQAVFAQAGQQGLTDIHRTIDNANASINDTMAKARTQALGSIAASAGKIPNSAYESVISNNTFGTDSWNGLGQSVGSGLDPSPVGPYQAFGA